LTFWFRFVYPNKSLIYGDFKIPQFNPDFNRYLGMVFEKIAAEFLWQIRPVDFTKIGRWWHKGEEIDLVALNDASKEVLFIECKWKTLSMAESMRNIEKLKKKTGFVMWNKGERTEYYGLVAKKVEGKDALREKGFMVFDLDDFISGAGSNFT